MEIDLNGNKTNLSIVTNNNNNNQNNYKKIFNYNSKIIL